MTADIYLAFEATDGETIEIALPDWRLPPPGWAPGVPLPAGNTYTDVAEEIPLEAQKATPATTPATVAANVQRLAAILNQGQRWANGEPVGPSLLHYTMPGSSPGKVLSAIIKGWDAARLLDTSFSDRIKKTGRALVAAAVARSGALHHTAWTIENLATYTAWGYDPVWSGATWIQAAMPGGGLGYLELAGLTTTPSPSGFVSVVNGTTYTVRFTASCAGISPGASVTVRFRNTADSANISNNQVILVPNDGPPDVDGLVYTATLTATATDATARLQLTTGADDVSIGEIAIWEGSGVDEPWHAQYAEHVRTYDSSAAAQNPAVMDALFLADHPTLSPMTLTLNRSLGGTDYQQAAAYLLVAPAAITFPGVGAQGALELYDWTDAVSAPWTSPAEGNGALGGTVKRFTPAGTTAVTQLGQAFASAVSSFTGPVQAFALIRNNSATTQFVIYLQYLDRQGVVVAETSRLVVPANATNPIWYPVGIGVVGRSRMRGFNVVVQASAASGTLDIDAWAFLKLQPGAAVVKSLAVNTGASYGYNQIIYAHRALEELAPEVYVANTATGTDAAAGYEGAARLMTSGDAVSAAWLATSTGKWRHYDTGGATLTAMSISATRLPAYITPE